MTHLDKPFQEASDNWDLERLYRDLSKVKGKNLSPIEKLHLKGLLTGHSPSSIATELKKSPNGTEVDLSNTVYRYVKGLLNDENPRIENWRNISEHLRELGYAKLFKQPELSGAFPVDALVKITNVRTNRIMIDINIRFVTSLPLSKDNAKEDDNTKNDF